MGTSTDVVDGMATAAICKTGATVVVAGAGVATATATAAEVEAEVAAPPPKSDLGTAVHRFPLRVVINPAGRDMVKVRATQSLDQKGRRK